MESETGNEKRFERIERHLKRIRGIYGYEYKSSVRILGMPLVHIASGVDPDTGKILVARGFIAIGQIAFGVLALGGIAIGGISIGGLSLAILFALGGLAAGGYFAAGGIAVAGFLAVGGLAISWKYAIGGMAIGPHPLGGNYQDPETIRFIRSFFPDWKF